MIEIKKLRQDAQAVADNLARRGFVLDTQYLTELEAQRKTLQEQTQTLQNQRNVQSKAIGQAKAKGEDTAKLMQAVGAIGQQLKDNEAKLSAIQDQLNTYLATLPNVLDDRVPDGKDESDNQIIRHWGEPTKFDFTPQDHVALGEGLAGMDFETASKLSGSRFVVLRGALARLQRALTQFMLDVHTQEHGYTETYVPFLVKSECFFGTGQLPKFAEDFFTMEGEHDLSLISTAEIPLTNTARDQIFAAEALPIRLTTHTPCFRSEAGSYGRDTRGMIRQHQFEKVELVHLVKPEDGPDALETLTQHAEVILQKLNLPYRVALLCAGDTGFSATRTHDLEVWLPGQDQYREISSCSYCLDFQARRIQARWRNPETGKPELLHTLNGSGLAVGRTLIAVMENYQDAEGNIAIPTALQPYMNGQTHIHCAP